MGQASLLAISFATMTHCPFRQGMYSAENSRAGWDVMVKASPTARVSDNLPSYFVKFTGLICYWLFNVPESYTAEGKVQLRCF